jgi:hypothetical protein
MREVGVQPPHVDAQQPSECRYVRRLGPEGEPGGDHPGLELARREIALDDGDDALFGGARRGKRGDDVVAQPLQQAPHRRLEQLILAAEIMMDDARGDTRLAADALDRGVGQSVAADRHDGRVDQLAAADRLHSDFWHAL